jgi:hypothetical protein
MTTRLRLGLVGVVVLGGLVFAGQALAAYTPKLVVSMDNTTTTIKLTFPNTDDPTALNAIFAPAGTGANLAAPAGTTIGTVEAKASAADLGGATLPLTGTIQARAATGTYLSSGQQVPISAAAQQCTGSPSHAAFWVLVLTAAGQTLEVPIFVDPTPAGQPFSAAVAYFLRICLPPPDIPPGTPGRASFGAKVFEAALTLRGVFSPTTGDNRWRFLGVPYNPGVGTVNLAGAREVQAIVERGTVTLGIPGRTLTRTLARFHVSGTVNIQGLPDTQATVTLLRGPTATSLSSIGTVQADSDGGFERTFAVRRGKRLVNLFVQARASAPERDLAATSCTATFGAPCIGVTASGFTATSSTRKIVVPKTPPPKKRR